MVTVYNGSIVVLCTYLDRTKGEDEENTAMNEAQSTTNDKEPSVKYFTSTSSLTKDSTTAGNWT